MGLADQAHARGLHRVGARSPLGGYLKQVWKRREFTSSMARFRVLADLEGNRLGVLWLVIKPSLNAVVYGLIFGVMQGDRRPPDYAAYVLVGVFLYEYFSGCLNAGARSITGNRNLVQSLTFPRVTLPLAEVIEQGLKLVPMLGILAVALPLMGHWPTWHWLLMIPLLGLYTLFNAGVAFFCARLTVHVRDLTQLLPFIGRVLFYTSGVLFDVDRILNRWPWAVELYNFHPLYQMLELGRGLLMTDRFAHPSYWWYFSGWSLAIFVAGLLFFWSAEERYGRD